VTGSSRRRPAYLARASILPGRAVVEPWQILSSLVGDFWHQWTYTEVESSGIGAFRGPEAVTAIEERAINAAMATMMNRI
jgi:hypothetical protein